MKTITTTVLTALAVFQGGLFVFAQSEGPRIVDGPPPEALAPQQRFYRGYGWGYTYPWDSGTTTFESKAKGMAHLLRAQSDAAKTNQETKRLELENNRRAAQIYQEQVQSYREQRAKEFAARKDRLAQRLSKESQASGTSDQDSQLTAEQFDPVTGKIHWPGALQGEEFVRHRQTVEDYFTARVSAGHASSNSAKEAAQTLDTMRDQLQGMIRQLPTMDYLLARRFIVALQDLVA